MNNGFLNAFVVESIPSSPSWHLVSDLKYKAKNGETYIVLAGQITDFFSIPGVFQSLLFRARSYAECAALHDAAYRGTLWAVSEDGRRAVTLSRSDSDKLIVESMRSMGAPRTLYTAIYAGLRIGGWSCYKGRG